QRRATLALALDGQSFDGLANHVLSVGGVLIKRGNDARDADGIMLGMPAIVVSDHGDGGVADLGFASELGFGDVGHSDDVELHGSMEVRLGEGGELGTFHADVSALTVDGNWG